MREEGAKGVTGRAGQFLRVDPAHWDLSKADMIPTHIPMLNQAVEALVRIYKAKAQRNPRLQIENAFVAVAMAAAMFESVLNLTLQEGITEASAFRELERSTPIAKWISLRGLTSPLDFASEPANGVRRLFRARNAIVHSKPDEGKRLMDQEGLTVQGVLRPSSVDRMIASAVEASQDAVSRAPWKGRLDQASVWGWPVILDNHGPLRYHLKQLPQESVTRTSILALAPTPDAADPPST